MKITKWILFIIFTCLISQTKNINCMNLDDYPITKIISKWGSAWSISKELFNYIKKILPEDAIVLEMGSGWGSEQLSKYYTVYSVEHDKKWIGKYKTNYIYAPIINKWYDPKILEKELPKEYDLILIDGPPGRIGRGGFYTYLHLFNTDVTIIFDDVHRKAEYDLMVKVSKKLQRKFTIYKDSFSKQFGVIAAKQ